MKTNRICAFLIIVTLLAGCGSPVKATPTAVKAGPYDYCQLQTAAPTPEILTRGDLGKIEAMELPVTRITLFQATKAHIYFVPVGFPDDGKGIKDLVEEIVQRFSGVNADFGLVDASVPVGIVTYGRHPEVNNWDEVGPLVTRLEADGIVFVVNTPLYIGQEFNPTLTLGSTKYPIGVAIFGAGAETDPIFTGTHETSHILGLDDGYQDAYNPERLPNSELFYLDNMPAKLKAALKGMPTLPTLYDMGSCQGRELYSYSDPVNNIMGSHKLQGGKVPPFSELQLRIMNNYIRSWKKPY